MSWEWFDRLLDVLVLVFLAMAVGGVLAILRDEWREMRRHDAAESERAAEQQSAGRGQGTRCNCGASETRVQTGIGVAHSLGCLATGGWRTDKAVKHRVERQVAKGGPLAEFLPPAEPKEER